MTTIRFTVTGANEAEIMREARQVLDSFGARPDPSDISYTVEPAARDTGGNIVLWTCDVEGYW